MNNIETFLEYSKTIAITLLVTFIVLVTFLFSVQKNVYNDLDKSYEQEDAIEYYLVGVLIEKNKYLEQQDPKNYKINLKLGILYEITRDFKNSEIQYEKAISKAPFNEYKPISKLANLYIKEEKLEEAQQLIDEISDKPNKDLIRYKAEIYFKIAENYYNSGNYLIALTKYQKSLFYYERIHSSKAQEVKNSMASAYVYIAEDLIEKLKVEEATNALVTANSLVKAPILKYKLALLLIKTDPDSALKYFEEVFNEEPGIMDFDVYYSFLTSLSDAADKAGNIGESKLYSYKAKKFKEYFQANILSVDDTRIEMVQGKINPQTWSQKGDLSLNFQLKNTSKNDLNSFFAHVIFRDGSRAITDYTKQIADPKSPLKKDSLSPQIFIKVFKNKYDYNETSENITAEIYVSKTEDSYKIYLTTVPLKKTKKDKKAKPAAQKI